MKNEEIDKNREIKCVFENNGKKITETFLGNTTIKEVKNLIQNKYNNTEKAIRLYFKGIEITKDNDTIGQLFYGSEIDLMMVSVTLTDSINADEDLIQEKLINKLTTECPFHKGSREINICANCNVAFCTQCSDKHFGHETIEKKKLISFTEELNKRNEYLNKIFGEYNLSTSYEKNEICKPKQDILNKNIHILEFRLNEIKKKSQSIIHTFKDNFDKFYFFLLEYKEKLEKLIIDSKRVNTIKNEQEFINYYFWYKSIKKNESKINESINIMRNSINNFNDELSTFSKSIENMITKTDEDFKYLRGFEIKDIQENLEDKNLSFQGENQVNASFVSNESSKSTRYKSRTNLINLLGVGDKINKKEHNLSARRYLEKENNKNDLNNERQKNEKKENSIDFDIHSDKDNKNSFFEKKDYMNYCIEKIDEKSEKDETLEEQVIYSLIYSIEPKTENILSYNKDKKIYKFKINFTDMPFQRFENYQATLNYQGKFYITGTHNSNKSFYLLNLYEKKFVKLANLLFGHSYHGFLGVENKIYCISGFKNKNVEKYDILKNEWATLPPVNISRSWPGSLLYKKKYIYIFGGLCDYDISNKEQNIKIERLDITKEKSWEIIKCNNYEILPFYFGFCQFENNTLLFLGGKYDSKENNIDICFSFNFEGNLLSSCQKYKLPYKDGFYGKQFIDLGEGQYGQFSTTNFNLLYIIDTNNCTINVINSEDIE